MNDGCSAFLNGSKVKIRTTNDTIDTVDAVDSSDSEQGSSIVGDHDPAYNIIAYQEAFNSSDAFEAEAAITDVIKDAVNEDSW
ncbi:hypothetical protein BGZ83_000872 [Gryganskiella cystojenkinii]|nr:hypothetical protein BGZ83_000872 [Gryganskiella cystojenkinii]